MSAVLAALLPALTSVGRHLSASLRAASRGTATSAGRWRRALVVAQVALAVVGLAGAGLLVSSFRELRAEATRLATDQLVYVPLDLPQDTYSDRARLRRLVTNLAETLEADPRVAGATPINVTPFSGVGWDVPVFTAEGQSDAEATANPPLNLEEIHPRYFSTFQVPLMRGRAFTVADNDTAPPVAIVSADVATPDVAGPRPDRPAVEDGHSGLARPVADGGRHHGADPVSGSAVRAFDAVSAGVSDDRGGRAAWRCARRCRRRR